MDISVYLPEAKLFKSYLFDCNFNICIELLFEYDELTNIWY